MSNIELLPLRETATLPLSNNQIEFLKNCLALRENDCPNQDGQGHCTISAAECEDYHKDD